MRTLSFILCTLLGLTSVFAQKENTSSLRWGMKTGVSVGAPIPTKLDSGSSGKLGVGPVLGFLLKKRLSDRVHLRGDLYYTSKGASYHKYLVPKEGTFPMVLVTGDTAYIPVVYSGEVNGKMRLHYVELPICASYRLSNTIHVSLGAQLSYLMTGKDAGVADIKVGDGTFPNQVEEYDNINGINKLDWGVNLKATYESQKGLLVDMRLTRSLNPLYKEGYLESQQQPETLLYHTHLQVGLGYWIN